MYWVLILQKKKKKYTLRVRDEHSSNDGPQTMAFKSPFGSSQQKKDKKESQPTTDLRVASPFISQHFYLFIFNFGCL